MKKKVGVVRFPGSNCDRDVAQWVASKGLDAEFLWHLDQFSGGDFEAVILPGGFSYGDYLRSGALAARSPVMGSVRAYAERGGPVLGICNGFQILTEAGLLPGALVRNQSLRFQDEWVDVVPVARRGFWSKGVDSSSLRLPIAHGDGRFYCDEKTLNELSERDQIWLKYVENPNGSLANIAGVLNEHGNVAALMPHPERAIFDWMGSTDGWGFL